MATRKSSGGGPFASLKRTKSSHDDSSDSQNDHRRRITIACVRCRKRKIRCDGAAECSKCVAAKHVCEYVPVSKEENVAARERKSAAKLARTASSKLAKITTDSASKVLERRRRTVTKLNVKRAESSATPEPSPTDYQNSHLAETHEYTLPSPVSPGFAPGSGDPRIFFSDGRAIHPHYMDYRSPSSVSFHSEQESDYYSTDMSLPPTPVHANFEEGNYFTPRFTNPFAASSAVDLNDGGSGAPQHPSLTRSQSTPFMHQLQHTTRSHPQAPALQHSQSYHADHSPYASPTPAPSQPSGLSFPSFSSAPPAGLCLYIPGSSGSSAPSFTPSPAYVSQSSQPSSPVHSMPPPHSRNNGNGIVYSSGPIDWTRRPLAPFPSVLLPPPSAAGANTLPSPNPSMHYAGMHEPMLSSYQHRDSMQTVRLDQICGASGQ